MSSYHMSRDRLKKCSRAVSARREWDTSIVPGLERRGGGWGDGGWGGEGVSLEQLVGEVV